MGGAVKFTLVASVGCGGWNTMRFRRVQCGCADQSTSSDPSCWQPRSGWGWPIEHTSSVWPVPSEPTTHPPSNQHTPHAQHYSLIHLTTDRESLTSTNVTSLAVCLFPAAEGILLTCARHLCLDTGNLDVTTNTFKKKLKTSYYTNCYW